MRRLRITRAAGHDLETIFAYGADRFGETVALGYRDALNTAFASLLEFPLSGRARAEIRPGLRSRPCGSHVIFYEPSEASVRIVRVLHGRMHTGTRV